jgi:peptidoglycan/LPS O-acetylase OafA/YrhL
MKPLGTFRFVLAFAVVYAHSYSLLSKPPIDPGLAATLGVLMFFTISGYIICFTVERWYQDRPIAFLANRALRIYPMHVVCYTLALLILWNTPAIQFGTLPPITREGLTPFEFLKTLLIFPSSGFYMNPPIWTVLVELQFYAFIGIATFFAQRKPIYWIAGMAASILTLSGVLSYDEHRMSFAFFALGGSLVYLKSRWSWPLLAISLLAVIKHIWLIPPGGERANLIHTLVYLATFGVLLVLISRNKAGRLDSFLGDLSYPLYACHFPALVLVGSQGRGGPVDWLFAVSACIAVAIALRFIVELPVSALRARLRSSSWPRSTETGRKASRLPSGANAIWLRDFISKIKS